MGVETKSSLEQEVLTQSRDCHVYGAFCFPILSPARESHDLQGSVLRLGMGARAARGQQSQRAHFYPYKIGAVDRHDADPKEYSFPGIMRELGHEFIDIWKVRFLLLSLPS
jgi:hypothetical protein